MRQPESRGAAGGHRRRRAEGGGAASRPQSARFCGSRLPPLLGAADGRPGPRRQYAVCDRFLSQTPALAAQSADPQDDRDPLGAAAKHRRYFNSDSTFSGGRPRAARPPETTIGRSTMIGFFAIASISAASDSAFGLMPAAAASFLRMIA